VVRIDPKQRHQTMLGFGGIATPTAYAQLSPAGKRRWWELVCEYNLRIQREYPIGTRLHPNMDNWDRLADATPHYYGDNFPNGEISDFAYLKTLRSLGGKVLFEFWALPPWARQDWTDDQGKVHQGVADPAKYARAMVHYCQTSQARAGAPPDIVGIQNEVNQPAAIWHEMTLALRRGLDEAGFRDVRIHMSDHGGLAGGTIRARAFQQSPEAWSAIDYAATHMYDYQKHFTDPDQYDELLTTWHELTADKPFLSTELCINNGRWQRPSYRLALTMGQLYHKNLTLADAVAICYCWTILNVVQPSYGWTRSLCVPDRAGGFVPVASSHQLRVFGAYSRRIQEGMTRVAATSSDPDLLASAFGNDRGVQTVVLLNRSTLPQRVRIEGAASGFAETELVDPYHANEIRPAPPAAPGKATEVEIPPGAIVTLTGAPLGKLPEGFQGSTK
jgi:O-glycosyl hydrolase